MNLNRRQDRIRGGWEETCRPDFRGPTRLKKKMQRSRKKKTKGVSHKRRGHCARSGRKVLFFGNAQKLVASSKGRPREGLKKVGLGEESALVRGGKFLTHLAVDGEEVVSGSPAKGKKDFVKRGLKKGKRHKKIALGNRGTN